MDGVFITKEIFDYLINGEISEEEWLELMKVIYHAKFNKKEILIPNGVVRFIWNKVKQKIVNQRDFTYPKQTFENHFKEIFQYCKDNNLIETIKSGNFDYSTMYGMFPDKKNTDASLDWIRYKYVPPKQVVLTSEGDDAPF